MKLHFFSSTLGVPWSNPWRTIYRQSKKAGAKDPNTQNILRVAGVLGGMGLFYFVLGPLSGKLGKPLETPLSNSSFIFVFVGVMVSLLVMLFCSDIGWREDELAEVTKKLAEEIFKNKQDVVLGASRSQLLAQATRELKTLGLLLRKAELDSGDPLNKGRVEAKKAFEDLFNFLRWVGLVDDKASRARFIPTSIDTK